LRIGIIGDVHGHAKELIEMIGLIEEHGVDRLILLGDLVDRGPDSHYCIRIARTWGFCNRDGNVRDYDVVRGNHEDAYWRILKQLPKPGRRLIEQPEERRFFSRLSREELEWFGSLPAYLEVPELNLVCIHGGVTPHYDSLEHGGEHMLRVRYLDNRYYEQRGLMGDVFWAEVYDGRFGTIFFGHESHTRPTAYDHAVAVDGEGYRRVHGVVVSNETGEEWLTAFTVPYGEAGRRETISYDPVRVHSLNGRIARSDVFSRRQAHLW
jgi:predicted phosphodiesterase